MSTIFPGVTDTVLNSSGGKMEKDKKTTTDCENGPVKKNGRFRRPPVNFQNSTEVYLIAAVRSDRRSVRKVVTEHAKLIMTVCVMSL